MTLNAMKLFGDERKTELQEYAQAAVNTFLRRVREMNGQV
jgi:hypothetical protein